VNLRGVLFGAGVMGKNHARVLSSLDAIELVGIVDPGLQTTPRNGDIPIVKSLSDLDYTDFHFAILATPTSTHEHLATELFRAGIPTLIEKPLSDTAPSAERILRASTDNGVLGAVGHIERFNPAIRELKARVQAGDIGRVLQIATRRQGSFPTRVTDIGVIKDLASHDIDLTMWIMEQKYASVSAYSHYRSRPEHEDMVAVTGQLSNGALVNHLVNWLSPMKERVVVVTGDVGTFVANTLSGDLTLYENGKFSVEWDSFANFRGVTEGDVIRFAYPKKEPLVTEIEGFIAATQGIGKDFVTLEEGLEVVRVADRIISSAKNLNLNLIGGQAGDELLTGAPESL